MDNHTKMMSENQLEAMVGLLVAQYKIIYGTQRPVSDLVDMVKEEYRAWADNPNAADDPRFD